MTVDTPRGFPMKVLLEHPAVLEWNGLAAMEKNFLMGLSLALLSGYCQMKANEVKIGQGLQHVAVN